MAGAAVELVSATQITLFRECPRKWAYRYLQGLKTPQHPAAALGTDVDDNQLQPYLRDGRPLDFTRESGYIAAAGVKFLPEPRSNLLEVQKHFVLPSPTDVFGFQGYIDLWLPTGGMPGFTGILPIVCDFKTTGNWKYAKTKETLATDVQAQLYAKWALVETEAPEVDLAWIYFATKGKRDSKRVHLRVTADHAEEQFQKINETAVEMYGHRKAKPNPLDLEPNPSMCSAYGGCPYQDKCNLSPTQYVDSKVAEWRQKNGTNTMTTTSTMGLLARLKAQKEAATGNGATNLNHAPATEQDKAEASARVAALIAGTDEVLGINPPEKDLPPAPPVGVVQVPDFDPTPASQPKLSATPVKRGPGRPRKQPSDPLAADAHAHTGPTENTPVAEMREEDKHPTYEAVAAVRDDAFTEMFNAYVIDVEWGEESFAPIPYNTVKVGPFRLSGAQRKGETVAQAQRRLYDELATFAAQVREEKLVAFKKTLEQIGSAR